MTFAGRHALVTGGGSGSGAAIARALAAGGAKVTIAGRRRPPLETVARDLPGTAIAVADITRAESCAAMADQARTKHGPIDIVIANAGAAESAPITKIDLAHWHRMIETNLTGTFLTVRACLDDVLRPIDSGDHHPVRRIVLIASTAGLKGYAYTTPYVAAKHGVVGLMRALACELIKHPVTVNAVCPGFMNTPLLDRAADTIAQVTGKNAAEARASLLRSMPQGRFVETDEVAAAVSWLCTPEARSVTGQAIALSGGEV
jgi:NAD(P)-dependent dehydrogenase (short-subunit alcohol dehydrogenase family)